MVARVFSKLAMEAVPKQHGTLFDMQDLHLSHIDSGMHQREHEFRTKHSSSRPKVRDADVPLNFFAAGFICLVVPHKLDCSVGILTMHFLTRLCLAQIRMSSEQICGVEECQSIEF